MNQRVVIPVPRERHRTLRVVNSRAEPVPKAMFQLVHDYAPTHKLPVIGDFVVQGTQWIGRLRVQGGYTDEQGETVLYGVPGVAYELVIEAPDCARQTFTDVVVDDGMSPRIVTLPTGAVIRGKLGPEGALDTILGSARASGGDKRSAPAVWLASLSTPSSPGDANLSARSEIRADGTFEVRGLGAGSYSVNPSVTGFNETIAEVRDLGSAETRAVIVLLEHLAQQPLSGQVLLDDSPFANGMVRLEPTVTNALGRNVHMNSVAVTTDAEGRFTTRLGAASWRAILFVEGPNGASERLASFVRVQVGKEPLVARFEARRVRLEVTVLDADGRPARGCGGEISSAVLRTWAPLTSDARGVVVLDPAPPGRLAIVHGPTRKELGVVEVDRSAAVQRTTVRVPPAGGR